MDVPKTTGAIGAFFSSDSGGSSASESPGPIDHSVQQQRQQQQQQLFVHQKLLSPDSPYIPSTNCQWLANSGDFDHNIVARRQLFINSHGSASNFVPSSVQLRQTISCPETLISSCAGSIPPVRNVFERSIRNIFIEPNSGMRDVPSWLKSLRLHKYTPMFQQMDYDQMLGLTEEQLEMQSVTKGARRKILQSVHKLRDRVDFLKHLEADLNEQGGIRTTLVELRTMVQTPIRGFPLLGHPEPSQAKIDGLNMSADQIDQHNLPAHMTRVLGKLHMTIFESSETSLEDDYFSILLHIYDRILNHDVRSLVPLLSTVYRVIIQAFTLAQKQRVTAWKRAVRRVFSPQILRRRPSFYQVSPSERRPFYPASHPAASFPQQQHRPSHPSHFVPSSPDDVHRRLHPWRPFSRPSVSSEHLGVLRDFVSHQNYTNWCAMQFQLLGLAQQYALDQQQQQQHANHRFPTDQSYRPSSLVGQPSSSIGKTSSLPSTAANNQSINQLAFSLANIRPNKPSIDQPVWPSTLNGPMWSQCPSTCDPLNRVDTGPMSLPVSNNQSFTNIGSAFRLQLVSLHF